MSKKRFVWLLCLISLFWLMLGWFANEYWQSKMRKIQSGMLIITAHEAAQTGDYDTALEYAAYALAYDKDSPLADIQIKEFTKKRASIRCDGKVPNPTASKK